VKKNSSPSVRTIRQAVHSRVASSSRWSLKALEIVLGIG
jgi:hypothetical protein